MTTINTTRQTTTAATQTGSGSQAGATYSNATLQQQGLEQGIKVAQYEASHPDFDMTSYTNDSVIPYLQSQGLSSAQVSVYVAAMQSEYNYLVPTGQPDNSNSAVGSDILNQVLPNAGEPGAAENPDTTSLQTLVDQGTTLGQQLAAVQNTNSGNFDIADYTQNLANEMTQAGYNSNQVDNFTSAVMMGYVSALSGYLDDGD